MKKLPTFCGIAFLSALCVFNVDASILEAGAVKIIFSPDKVEKNVTWSDNFFLKETGLETKQLPENQSQDVWIQTHAFPIGLSWRPPSGAGFTAYLDGSINDVNPDFRIDPQIFIRYSCDKVNWSTWYSFTKTEKKSESGSNIYESKIWLPASATENYYKLMRDWWKTNPAWSSDEHEFVEWLVKKEPDFFVREKPFIGYVQVRVEKPSVNPSQNIRSMNIGYTWAVSGLASIAKDKSKVRKNTEDKWFFEAAK